jgi:hypothetical protein
MTPPHSIPKTGETLVLKKMRTAIHREKKVANQEFPIRFGGRG